MNTLIKRSMTLALTALIVGVAVGPAYAQRRGLSKIAKVVTGKKPPRAGLAPEVHVPVTPRVPPSTLTGAAVPPRTPAIPNTSLGAGVERNVAAAASAAQPLPGVQSVIAGKPALVTPREPIALNQVPGFVPFNLYFGEKISDQFPTLRNQVRRFIILNDIRGPFDPFGYSVYFYIENSLEQADRLFEHDKYQDYRECWDIATWHVGFNYVKVPKKLDEALLSNESPLNSIFEWRNQQKLYAAGKIPVIPQKPVMLVKEANPISREKLLDLDHFLTPNEFALLGRKAGTKSTYEGNIEEVFRRTDELFFEEHNGQYYAVPEVAAKYPDYKELWFYVAKKHAPSSVMKYLPEDWESLLGKVFEARNEQIKHSLEGVTAVQKTVDITTQRTAEEIQALVENLPADNPLRQSAERMLQNLEQGWHLAPVESTTP